MSECFQLVGEHDEPESLVHGPENQGSSQKNEYCHAHLIAEHDELRTLVYSLEDEGMNLELDQHGLVAAFRKLISEYWPKNRPRRSIKYVETVRKKHDRTFLKAKSCDCCSKYYESTDDAEFRIQESSRHRYLHLPPPTPSSYWDVDF